MLSKLAAARVRTGIWIAILVVGHFTSVALIPEGKTLGNTHQVVFEPVILIALASIILLSLGYFWRHFQAVRNKPESTIGRVDHQI